MSHPFFLYGLRVWINELERTSSKEYEMSQIGNPTEKVTIKPETSPVPPKTMPAPQPVEQPAEVPG